MYKITHFLKFNRYDTHYLAYKIAIPFYDTWLYFYLESEEMILLENEEINSPWNWINVGTSKLG